jgi:uncharacterized membrane protein YkvA (DUF1232 family)
MTFADQYSEESFRKKLQGFALRAGRQVIEKALVLYYCLQDRDTPKWTKAVIVGALGYFIAPLDAVPDFTPVFGFVDDLTALALALPVVAVYVKHEHHERAREKLSRWFR